MFDLFRSQAKASKILLSALLGLVALSMVAYLIPGFGSPSSSASNSQTLAQVGDEPITTAMIQRVLAANQSSNIPADLAPTVVNNFLGQFVNQLAEVHEARRLGLQVSDQELAQGIQGMIPMLYQDGKFVGAEAYQQVLAQQGSTVADFENNIRKQLLSDKMQAYAMNSVVVTPAEIEAEYRKMTEKATMELVKLDPETLKSKVNVPLPEIQKYYDNNKTSMFMMATRRSAEILITDEKLLGENIAVNEADLRKSYDAQKDRFRTEERVHARHILVMTKGKPDSEKPKLKQKAEDLLKQVRAGGDFAALAKANSDDTSSGPNGGDLDWFPRGRMLPAFENVAFGLKPKDISNIVETEYGYHIIQMLEKEDAKLKPFEEVKADLLTEARRRQVYERIPVAAEEARVELMKNPNTAEAIAKKLHLMYVKADKIAEGSMYPTVGSSPEFESELAKLAKGGVTPLVTLPGNKLLVAVLNDVIPPAPRPFSEVQKQIQDQLTSQRTTQMNEERDRKFGESLRANHNDLKKTAEEFGLKMQVTNEFDRNSMVDSATPAASYADLPFTSPIGAAVTFRVNGIPHFFKVINRAPGDMSQLALKRGSILTTIRTRKQAERKEMYQEGLVRRLTENGTIKIFDSAVKQFIGSFGS